MKTDILIVGSGCSGLYAVLNLPEELDIMLITKSDLKAVIPFGSGRHVYVKRSV